MHHIQFLVVNLVLKDIKIRSNWVFITHLPQNLLVFLLPQCWNESQKPPTPTLFSSTFYTYPASSSVGSYSGSPVERGALISQPGEISW